MPNALSTLLEPLARAGDRTAAYLWFDQKYFLPDDILAKVDRISMAHSIEVRPPFLDHRIVEFAARLPENMKVAGATQKVILRRLMKNRLPDEVLQRKKIGFDIPAHEWLRGPLLPLLRDTLEAGLDRARRIVRPPRDSGFRGRSSWRGARTMDITYGA